ncbi:type II toxin-antitoxin system VapC family toxin [Microbacterium luticocti]|uniref:type II toxin-antitoxin system VapC family toxin n=1 Tax=Microbacterium luticocti TaxID=451764 RepID=UPI00040EA32E|nr:type II toxin-antitoxin system VapC family toxin [Microbacterium luticocti]
MTVFDASALLAFLQTEHGADIVAEYLEQGGTVSAANWSETAQKVQAAGADWALARGLLLSYGIRIEPVSEADAEAAARLWRRGDALSLGDRLCLALGEREGGTILTADTAWSGRPGVVLVR